MSRVVFALSDLDQSTGQRHLKQGSLITSQNTRTTKTGSRRKRRGFTRQAPPAFSFPDANDDVDSSPSATMQELSPGGAMFRDANENIWARDTAGNNAYFRGEHRRCGITAKDTGLQQHKTIKPVSILVGTEVWHFCLATTQTGGDPTTQPLYDRIWFIREDANGTVISSPSAQGTGAQGPGLVGDSTGNSILNYCVVYHPSDASVWVFTVYGNTEVRSRRINAVTGLVGGSQAFVTTALMEFNTVDAIFDTTTSRVMVAYSSWNEAAGNVAFVRHSRLDPATGLESIGVSAQANNPGTTGARLCGGVSWLQGQPFTDGLIRYVYWVYAGGTTLDLRHVIVTSADSTIVANASIHTVASTRDFLEHAGVCTGFYVASTNFSIVFAQVVYPIDINEETTNPTGVGNAFNQVTARIFYNNSGGGGGFVDGNWAPGSWLASKPWNDTTGSPAVWYVLTGVDSGTDGYQRAFHIRRADMGLARFPPDSARIVGQFFWPDASSSQHRWGNVAQLPPTVTNAWGWAPTQATIASGAVKLTAGRTGELPQTHAIHIVTLDFNAAFSVGALVYDDLVVYPGSVPCVAGPRSPAHDLTPMVFPVQPPRRTAQGSSTALGNVFVTSSFRFRDPSGRITRSTSYPDPAVMSFNSAGTRTLAVRACQHIGHGNIEIELWASIPGGTGLNLQVVVPNNPDVNEVSIDVLPELFRDDTELLPISAVGSLAHNPPPPCRSVAMFAERVIISGTPVEGEFLYSQPIEAGLGPEFNIEALTQTWIGHGPINAMSPVDLNTLALFRKDQIAGVQGPGPAGEGGAYGQILELNTICGVESSATRGHVVLRTRLGAVFQNRADGRLWIVEPGLRVEEMPPGVEDTVQASRLVAGGSMESEGTVWFHLFTGSTAALVLIDLRQPEETKASRWGAWHVWNGAGWTGSACVGLAEVAAGPLWLQANGSWRSYKTTGNLFQDFSASNLDTEYIMSIETGQLAPDGHHGECCILDANVIGTHFGASGFRITTTNDAGTAENHDVTLATPFNYSWRPGNLLRTQEFKLRLEEITSSATTEGFEVDSVGVEYEVQGRMKRLPTTKVI